jgi:hypothetical protein
MSGFTGRHILAVVASIVVAAAVGTGIVLMGPPGEERSRRLDERRVEDLHQISLSVNLYNTRHKRLPSSLAELSQEPGLSFQSGDPVTGERYGYSVLEATMYQLCGVFDRESKGTRDVFWSHGNGRHCFVVKADEAR